MIKKFLNVFMCIGLLMQNFLFVMPVMAEEVKEPTIKINGIYQGDDLAEIDEDGNYVIDKYDEVILDFELENIKITDDYYVKIESSTYGGSSFMYNNTTGVRKQIYFNNFQYEEDDIFTYDIKICDEWECNKQYASETINFKLTYFDDVKDSKIIISDIKQGNNEIIAEDTDDYVKYIYLNNKQNISFKLTGENLIDDADYKLNANNIEEARTQFRNEKRREFCFEDMRWYDMKRWGVRVVHQYHEIQNSTAYTEYVLEADSPNYILPLPLDVQRRNTKIEKPERVDTQIK